MNHPRTAIRKYIQNLLIAKDIVGNKVFVNRTDSAMRSELPCINIFNVEEDNDIYEGDKHVVHQYERSYRLQIDCCSEQPNNIEGQEKIEDILDSISREVERAINDDYFLNKMLDSYTGETTDDGLAVGLHLIRTEFNSANDEEGIVAAQSMIWEILYLDNSFIDYKSDIFETYLMQIKKVGWNESTVDPNLIEAEGVL